jgi:flagellar biosynthesis protein FlhG
MEAEADFQSKLSYIEDLLHTGALSMGDLVEAIKSQQFELSLLKRENQLLKSKLARAIQEGFEP